MTEISNIIEKEDINGVSDTLDNKEYEETTNEVNSSVLGVLYRKELFPFGELIKSILDGGFNPGSMIDQLEEGRKERKHINRFDEL